MIKTAYAVIRNNSVNQVKDFGFTFQEARTQTNIVLILKGLPPAVKQSRVRNPGEGVPIPYGR
jgi:hypothetical protein